MRIQEGLEEDDALEQLVIVWREAGRQAAEQLLSKMPPMQDDSSLDMPTLLERLGVEPSLMGWDDEMQDWN